MKCIYLFCIAVCLICCSGLQAQGILGKLKKEVTKKDQPTEAKPATTTAGTQPQPTSNTTSSATSTPAKETTTQAEQPVVPILEWPETQADRVASDAYVVPKHADYIGKIVFSDKKLTTEATTAASLRPTFAVDEPVYARVFLKTAVKNYALYSKGKAVKGNAPFTNDRGKYYVRIYIDGQLQDRFIMTNGANSGRSEGWNTWQLYVSARGEDAKENSSALNEAVNKLPAGNHVIKLELYGGGWGEGTTAAPLAAGEFTYNKAAGKRMKQGRAWTVYKEEMVNPMLTKEAVSVMNKEAESENWKETYIKAKIAEKDWTIIKNAYTGITLSRRIDMYLYATWPDGHCTVQIFSLEQQYGAGQFSKVLDYRATGDQYEIDCD